MDIDISKNTKELMNLIELVNSDFNETQKLNRYFDLITLMEENSDMNQIRRKCLPPIMLATGSFRLNRGFRLE